MTDQEAQPEFAGASIVVGVTGSIAAYKAAELVSKLKQNGAEVHVVMTRCAQELVGPMTFHSLSMNPVHTELFPEGGSARPHHIDLVDQADLVVIAPATANIIGKIAAGLGDDILSTTVLAAWDLPVIVAPAMNVRMYANPIVQRNIAALEEAGYVFVEPEEGYLACGYEGKGRLASLDRILDTIRATLDTSRKKPRQFPKRPV